MSDTEPDAAERAALGAALAEPACVFCERITAGEYDDEYDGIVDFEPLNPVTPGHRLVVPKLHVADALEDPAVTAEVVMYAADYAVTAGLSSCNLITSAGAAATQTVMHLHVHVVPRREGDGLALPWTVTKAAITERERIAKVAEDLGAHYHGPGGQSAPFAGLLRGAKAP